VDIEDLVTTPVLPAVLLTNCFGEGLVLSIVDELARVEAFCSAVTVSRLLSLLTST